MSVLICCCRHEPDKKLAVDKDVVGTWAEQLEAAEQAAKVDEYVTFAHTGLSPNSTLLVTSRHNTTRSTCRAHAFWLCRACRTARPDTLVSTCSTLDRVVSRRDKPSWIWVLSRWLEFVAGLGSVLNLKILLDLFPIVRRSPRKVWLERVWWKWIRSWRQPL